MQDLEDSLESAHTATSRSASLWGSANRERHHVGENLSSSH